MILWILAILIVILLGFVVVGMRGGGIEAFDADGWMQARAERDDLDTEQMLELHNTRRLAQGLDPLTRAEFEEHVRRGR